MTIFGASLWGLSGVCSQYLFAIKQVPTAWLIAVRLTLAGILFFVFAWSKPVYRESIRRMFSSRKTIVQMLIYAIFGLLLGQITYFYAIEYSNASTATVLQYTSPILIMLYTAFRSRRFPRKMELSCLVIVMAGVFLLATHGSFDSLSISGKALLWGLSASFTMMLYSILPEKLMKEFETVPVIAVAMPFCGFLMSAWVRPIHTITGVWDEKTVLVLVCIILLGTFFSFYFYLRGLNLVGASKASICTAAEPVTSTILTIVVMHMQFVGMDILGLLLIVGGVLLLTVTSQTDKDTQKTQLRDSTQRAA